MSLPRDIAQKGEVIYKAKYKRGLEQLHFGQYIAIDVESAAGFVAPSAAIAIRHAQDAGKPGALFHLVRIGYRSRIDAK
jgi:hypothetical protein